ncbi:MAG: hypothetical protein H6923_09475 [Alphaproteobacteria bacterium]|nr:hypothetical protein [Alphaproteobacteria bacterium]
MDWTALILATISGALGGLLGGLLGLPFKNKTARAVALVVPVVLCARLLPDVLEPHLGPLLRTGTGQDDAVERQLDSLRDEPVFAAILERGDVSEEEIKARLVEAYRKGGTDGLAREAARIGQEYGGSIAFAYFPRARNEDLIDVASALVDIQEFLVSADPGLCYRWLFGGDFDPIKFDRLVGRDRAKALGDAFTAVIRNGYDAVPEFDRVRAQIGMRAAVIAALGQSDANMIAVATGQRRAATREEETFACRASHDIYAYVLGLENAADVLRLMFIQ